MNELMHTLWKEAMRRVWKRVKAGEIKGRLVRTHHPHRKLASFKGTARKFLYAEFLSLYARGA